MLIGNVMEKTDAVSAWQLCADKLADWVRSNWLEHDKMGMKVWEISMPENDAALPGLRAEGFKDVIGVDYILKWWGSKDTDELAGELDVIWKIAPADGSSEVICYRTWVRLASRDFILGLYKDEGSKRDYNRGEFRKAFLQWKKLFEKI